MEGWLLRLGLAAVVLAPLPLGSYRPWAWQGLAAVFALLAAAQAMLTAVGRERTAAALPPVAVGLWAVALAWAAVQAASPWPAVRPELWAEAAAALGQPPAPRASLDPAATRQGLLRLLTWTAAAWLFAQWAASRRRAALVLAVVGWAGAAWAALALVLLAAGDRLPFAAKTLHLGFATGPFPNRNTLALWLGMSLCALLAAAVQRQVWRRPAAAAWLLAALTTAAALLATQSRAGIVAAAAGLLVTAGRLWRPRPAVAAAAAVVLAAAIALSPVGVRLASTSADAAANPRLTVWATTLEGIADAPLTGIGLGAFPDAFAERRPRALLHPWAQAHNVYLELAWELGLPATAALLAALALIGWRLLRSPSATAAAGLGALTAAALHALADFSPQVPAAALLLATLMGAGCGRAGAAP